MNKTNRTQEEIDVELARLRDLAPRIRQFSAFGDSNREKIDAQIEILAQQLCPDDFYVDEDDEDFNDGDQEVYYAAVDAENWLMGGTSLADEWEPLVQE